MEFKHYDRIKQAQFDKTRAQCTKYLQRMTDIASRTKFTMSDYRFIHLLAQYLRDKDYMLNLSHAMKYEDNPLEAQLFHQWQVVAAVTINDKRSIVEELEFFEENLGKGFKN